MVGMLEADFFIQPHPKQVQLLIKTKLWGKFQLTPTSKLVSVEEHIEPPFDLASSLPSLSNLLIDLEPTSTKQKLDLMFTNLIQK
jgi:hypothetical protein